MTKKELIAALDEFPDDAKVQVFFGYDCADHWCSYSGEFDITGISGMRVEDSKSYIILELDDEKED